MFVEIPERPSAKWRNMDVSGVHWQPEEGWRMEGIHQWQRLTEILSVVHTHIKESRWGSKSCPVIHDIRGDWVSNSINVLQHHSIAPEWVTASYNLPTVPADPYVDQFWDATVSSQDEVMVIQNPTMQEFRNFVLSTWKKLTLCKTNMEGGKSSFAVFCRMDIRIRLVHC